MNTFTLFLVQFCIFWSSLCVFGHLLNRRPFSVCDLVVVGKPRHEMARLQLPKTKTLDPRLRMSRMTGGGKAKSLDPRSELVLDVCNRGLGIVCSLRLRSATLRTGVERISSLRRA